ncbi:release factor glutamine methyltransferase [mine drainage metagenome]|uniref:peptide chain release factor N(5)-glutamine methyltransferase n=1 Tax=mine drainage metagenome TaxID=410659 RepID=A0A1J5RQP6_9ZZZZ
MSVQEAYKKLLFQLSGLYDNREAANIADMVMEHITGYQKTNRIIHKNILLDIQQQAQLQKCIEELLQHKPIQYVLQEAWFYGMKFFVNESVLIPRPETEELIDWVTQEINNKNIFVHTALDIGSGSGCIPIALKKKNPHISISSIDISKEALVVAKKNAGDLGIEINFFEFDFLNESRWAELSTFDLIISNPPYIKQSESKDMRKNVLDFEPHIALFVPDSDSLIFYKKLAAFGKEHLAEDGKIFAEINENSGEDVIKLFTNENYSVELKKDMRGKDRMLKAVLK